MVEDVAKASTITTLVDNQKSLETPASLVPWEYALDDGTVIRGLRTPPSGKPVIHFLHGNGFCGLVYWPMLRHFLPDYDLFLQDVQGHGHSDSGPYFYGWNGNAERAHQVWQAFEPDYAQVEKIAMGHSFGGVLSLLMAAKFPSSFQRLVLLDPVIFNPLMYAMIRALVLCGLPLPNPMAKRAKSRCARWPSKQAAMDYLCNRGIFKGWDSQAFESYINYALSHHEKNGSQLRCAPQREYDIFASAPQDLWRLINKIRIPTSLFYGANSYPFVRKSARKLRSHRSFIHVNELSGGHCFMQENPKDVANHIIQYL